MLYRHLDNNSERKDVFLAVLAKTGRIDAACCAASPHSSGSRSAKSTFYELRKRDPEFAAAWNRALGAFSISSAKDFNSRYERKRAEAARYARRLAKRKRAETKSESAQKTDGLAACQAFLNDERSKGCEVCGYVPYHLGGIEFHHIVPEDKQYDFRAMPKWSIALIREELVRCARLCTSCHKIAHALIGKHKDIEIAIFELYQMAKEIREHNRKVCS